MKKKTWKRCVCMIGVVLFAVTGLNANNRVPDSPIKKTRSNTFIIEKEKSVETVYTKTTMIRLDEF